MDGQRVAAMVALTVESTVPNKAVGKAVARAGKWADATAESMDSSMADRSDDLMVRRKGAPMVAMSGRKRAAEWDSASAGAKAGMWVFGTDGLKVDLRDAQTAVRKAAAMASRMAASTADRWVVWTVSMRAELLE